MAAVILIFLDTLPATQIGLKSYVVNSTIKLIFCTELWQCS
jgi:hypothetical protein